MDLGRRRPGRVLCPTREVHFSWKDQRRPAGCWPSQAGAGAVGFAQARPSASCLTRVEDKADVVWSSGGASHSSEGLASGQEKEVWGAAGAVMLCREGRRKKHRCLRK